MSGIERVILGGCSALLPISANLYFTDWESKLVSGATLTIQIGVLFFAGCLVAYLHDKETSKQKIFQLGLAVPSFLFSIQNGIANKERIESLKVEHQSNLGATSEWMQEPTEIDFPFIQKAYAQARQDAREKAVMRYSMPRQSISQSVWRGLTGSSPENIWYVIASSHKTQTEAQQKAQEINKSNPNVHAEVYAPYQGNPFYSVIVGSNMSLEDAKKLHASVKEKGIAKDAYLWSLK
jgi:hypothetical protein